jgi:hypothetical protein
MEQIKGKRVVIIDQENVHLTFYFSANLTR